MFLSFLFLRKEHYLRCNIYNLPLLGYSNEIHYLHCITKYLKVPITPKSFFRFNKSLHLFEKHCTFLTLLNPNIDLLQAIKVTKSGHHLSHDPASKGYGSIPRLTSQTSLHACLQRLSTMQISL